MKYCPNKVETQTILTSWHNFEGTEIVWGFRYFFIVHTFLCFEPCSKNNVSVLGSAVDPVQQANIAGGLAVCILVLLAAAVAAFVYFRLEQ